VVKVRGTAGTRDPFFDAVREVMPSAKSSRGKPGPTEPGGPAPGGRTGIEGRATRSAPLGAVRVHPAETIMLSWAILFLIIALVAGIFGFGLLGATAMGFAKILFFVFLVVFIVSLVLGRRPPA
jgi:uncharacterized membrane protein YtjA (UPF0391 family)